LKMQLLALFNVRGEIASASIKGSTTCWVVGKLGPLKPLIMKGGVLTLRSICKRQ
jgi:hypothetical protein